MSDVRDKVVIVTGSGAGIGEAYCFGLARRGAKVVVTDIVPQSDLEQIAEEIRAEGGEAIALQVDVTSKSQTEEMAAQVVGRWGRIDGLVNNAAYQEARAFNEYSEEEFQRMMSVNVMGPWLCTMAVYPYMEKQGRGKVVNIGSQTFFSGWIKLAPYVASKGAVIGMTRALAREVSRSGVNFNCLCPGLTVTEGSLREVAKSIHPGRTNEWLDTHVEEQSIGHPGYPEDLVGALAYLLSDDSDFMTGQTLVVDGGWAMH